MEATSTVDLLGCFAVAGELGRGQPAGHVAATTAIAVAVAGEIGLTETEKAATYYTGLLVHACAERDCLSDPLCTVRAHKLERDGAAAYGLIEDGHRFQNGRPGEIRTLDQWIKRPPY